MKTNYIEFKKKRELGEILSDTFAFLRQEFKPFLATFFKIVGPYLLVLLISFGFYYVSISGMTNMAFSNSSSDFNETNFATMAVTVITLIVSSIATFVMAQSTTLYYIKSYANTKGNINFNEIKKNVYKSFWSFVGLGLLVGLCLFIGLIFCFFPAVYLYVPLTLSFAIMVFNKKDVIDSFSYSFQLIKEHWWITFATMFVLGIIVGVAGFAFGIPATIYQYAKMGILGGEVDPTETLGIFSDPIFIALNVISMFFKFILNIISLVAGVFIYFNLNEIKNFEGTYERIKNLGEDLES